MYIVLTLIFKHLAKCTRKIIKTIAHISHFNRQNHKTQIIDKKGY